MLPRSFTTLRFILDDNRKYGEGGEGLKHQLSCIWKDKKMRLDALANASRRVGKFVKANLSKHQGPFQKAIQLVEKGLSSVQAFFSEKLPKKLNYSSPLKAASSAALMICSISTSGRFEVSTTT